VSWGFPIIHCPHCHHVGKPALTEGTSARTWTATCTACLVVIKQLPRLGEPAPVASEAPRGAQLYAKSDLARAALQELARRKLLAMGIDPDAPGQGKHSDG
jgi:hypothetical protein